MSEYIPTIGLEVHAELKTKTKMFCNSRNDPEEKRPNVNICPICMAHPGTLPVINKEAVRHVIKVGLALGGAVADFTEFDRKNYFYPDIPKGYQISQYKYPLISGGNLNGIAITKVHLEEDTARSTHDRGDYTLVDFNRAGIPLMELVTEPVVRSAVEASAFARELQLLLRYLGAGDANMEKGEMRVEANISVSKTDVYGTKVEVKNLNSFKVVEKAIAYEIKRQSDVLESGGKLVQETRGWDETKQETFSQREKESSHDYRYFPDPDLPKLKLSEISELTPEVLLKELPKLPWERRKKYLKLGLKSEDAEMYVRTPFYGDFFDNVTKELTGDGTAIKTASNVVSSDLAGLYKGNTPETLPISPKSFADLSRMYVKGEISSRGMKDILTFMVKGDSRSPRDIAFSEKLFQESSEDKLGEIVEKVISANPTAAAEYKNGKEESLQFLIGQGMKEARGSANPQVLKNLFIKELR